MRRFSGNENAHNACRSNGPSMQPASPEVGLSIRFRRVPQHQTLLIKEALHDLILNNASGCFFAFHCITAVGAHVFDKCKAQGASAVLVTSKFG